MDMCVRTFSQESIAYCRRCLHLLNSSSFSGKQPRIFLLENSTDPSCQPSYHHHPSNSKVQYTQASPLHYLPPVIGYVHVYKWDCTSIALLVMVGLHVDSLRLVQNSHLVHTEEGAFLGCMYVCMYVCMYACMHLCIYALGVYVCIHIFIYVVIDLGL